MTGIGFSQSEFEDEVLAQTACTYAYSESRTGLLIASRSL